MNTKLSFTVFHRTQNDIWSKIQVKWSYMCNKNTSKLFFPSHVGSTCCSMILGFECLNLKRDFETIQKATYFVMKINLILHIWQKIWTQWWAMLMPRETLSYEDKSL